MKREDEEDQRDQEVEVKEGVEHENYLEGMSDQEEKS